MNKSRLNIWGRNFELEVEYDCYSNENVLPIQKEALKSFISATSSISEAKCNVEKYCITNNSIEIGSENIDNIFKYIIPKYLYVKRDEEKHIVAIMCNYKFDSENGLAVVFINEKFEAIGKQSIIL